MPRLPRAFAPLFLTTAVLYISLSSPTSAHGVHELVHASHGNDHNHHNHAHDHAHDHSPTHDRMNGNAAPTCLAPTPFTVRFTDMLSTLPLWAAALLSSLLTGLASLSAVALLPLHGSILKPLLPFATGALLSDCALHLLPTIYQSPASSSGHIHASLGSGAGALLCGVCAFSVLDAVCRYLSGGCGHAHDVRGERAARMNLAADAVHNLCDGLSIGAAYLGSRAAGAATTLAVLLHELPQEVGDFAVLLRAGWSRRRALAANLACAATAVLGTAAALLFDRVASDAARAAILPFAAGGVLYLALTALLPDVLEDLAEHVPTPGAKDAEAAPPAPRLFLARLIVAVAASALGAAAVAVIEQAHAH